MLGEFYLDFIAHEIKTNRKDYPTLPLQTYLLSLNDPMYFAPFGNVYVPAP